ncbi:aminopeptidase N [Tessaracoccus caeni]|uniref:aminopeptidase N n=1 Tax=Tessaracoccus caeni TaxID=3031239 RepID=UPI0023DBF6C4|nr:aminopeptidase N [Tessaracoccus caeni]MDF1487824.1 aminopeptidase N [Tessaracoccus caeni]
MATANITRDEAGARSEIISMQAYRVTVDLTGREVTEPERQFVSTTELDLTATGGSTHLDLIADEIREATLDGEPFDVAGHDGYRLPLPELSEGPHTVRIVAVCRYSRSGEGLHRFVDPADDRVYLYSQFEAPDSRRMYAVAEQPDQKATFQLTVLAPAHWAILTNAAAVEPEDVGDGFARWTHEPTPRVSTYITALVAGEYHVERREIQAVSGVVPASVACRQSLVEYLDTDRIITTTQRGFDVFEKAFGVPYAFGTYDQIFVPEYNFGAMENAGCITFRDEYLFRSRVTARELESRDNTILHELAHMWFGDLVTMQWWDDLWLNESFAEWASHYAADQIRQIHGGDANPWAAFSSERKAWAYTQDQYPTTHPIAADMSDLEKVEQNFDGITYAKGASVLKLLVSLVGEEAFLAGVGAYFRAHAYGNTTLDDLLVELEAASGRDLSWFSAEWLETSGVNTLAADFDIDDEGRFTRFDVIQTAHPDWPTLRTHRLGIGLYESGEDGLQRAAYVEADIAGERTSIEELIGKERRDVVLLNDGDLTFAKVRLDADSLATLSDHMDALDDPLARAVTWTALWDMTRDAELSASAYTEIVLRGLASEKNPAATSSLLNQLAVAASSYTAPELRDAAKQQLVKGLARLLKRADAGSDKQLQLAKALVGASSSPAAIELIQGWLNGEEVPAGLTIDTAVRWEITFALAKNGVIGVDDIERERTEHDNTSAGAEQAAGARAALPDAEEKARAWALATADPSVPNETHRQICAGVWRFGQEALMGDYVDAYLDVLGDISRRENGWEERGYAAIAAVVRFLYPAPLATSDVIEQIEAWISDNDPAQQVRRLLDERLDDSRRALRAQELSRA